MDEKEDLETLGEQLYPLIYHKHQENAAKLTGMLLELPAPVVIQMLQDEAQLSEAVEKALRALQLNPDSSWPTCKEEDDMSTSSDALGEQLFELVDVYNTGHSQKITGMLLEQHRDAVEKLLSDSRLLEQQIQLALKMLLEEQEVEETDVSDLSDADDSEKLGEKLFILVEKMDPLHANDITGMLLEMEPAVLHQLFRDQTLLELAVQKAQAALEAHS